MRPANTAITAAKACKRHFCICIFQDFISYPAFMTVRECSNHDAGCPAGQVIDMPVKLLLFPQMTFTPRLDTTRAAGRADIGITSWFNSQSLKARQFQDDGAFDIQDQQIGTCNGRQVPGNCGKIKHLRSLVPISDCLWAGYRLLFWYSNANLA